MEAPTHVIAPGPRRGYWRECWRSRELLLFLAWRDVIVRYRQTAIGVLWALIKPLLALAVFTVVFGRIARLPSHDAPYAVLVMAALIPWQFFANVFAECAVSVIGNASLIGKIWFPRALLPISTVLANLVELVVATALLVALMLWTGHPPGLRMLALPLLVVPTVIAALGPGLIAAAAMARFPDLRNVVPYAIQAGLLLSPIGFSSAIVPAAWRPALYLNPLSGVIDLYRWCAISDAPLAPRAVALSLASGVALLLVGMAVFRTAERRLADRL